MAKVLTREECLKKSYNKLYDLNQRLKNISSLYYIGDGVVYMKSLVPFLESFIELRYPEHYTDYINGIITPNALFDFGKRAKKSKMHINEKDDKEGHRFEFRESDLLYTLNIIPYELEELKKYLNYKRFFEVQDHSKYDVFECEYYPLTTTNIEDLCSAKYLELTLPTGDLLALTKHLFLDIKKGDSIQIKRVARQLIDRKKNEYRLFFIINHSTELYTKYTIFNKISSKEYKIQT